MGGNNIRIPENHGDDQEYLDLLRASFPSGQIEEAEGELHKIILDPTARDIYNFMVQGSKRKV